MTVLYPSYVGKVNRAEHHLKKLKAAALRYGGADESDRPYAVRKRMEGKPKRECFRLEFTRSVDTTTCGCRKCHPRASSSQFVLVEKTTELVSSS